MKIITFGDIHSDLSIIPLIYDEIASSDLLIISGDITTYGNFKDAVKVISYLRRANSNILAVMGNLDDDSVLKYLESENLSIHGKGVKINGVGIFGVGGSNLTPFKTPTEYNEEEIKRYLKAGYEMIADAEIKIMVSHVPPYETKCDLISSSQHVGSRAVRSFITNYLPHINICGHVHEGKNIDTIGRTKVINTGCFKDGGYSIFDTDDPSGFFKNVQLLNAFDKEKKYTGNSIS